MQIIYNGAYQRLNLLYSRLLSIVTTTPCNPFLAFYVLSLLDLSTRSAPHLAPAFVTQDVLDGTAAPDAEKSEESPPPDDQPAEEEVGAADDEADSPGGGLDPDFNQSGPAAEEGTYGGSTGRRMSAGSEWTIAGQRSIRTAISRT